MGMENSFTLVSDSNKVLVNFFCNFNSLHQYIRENFDNKIDDNIFKCSVKDLKLLKYELKDIYRELLNIGSNVVGYYDDNEYPTTVQKSPMLLTSHYFRPTEDYNGTKIFRLYETLCALIMLLENDFDNKYEVIYECSY